MVVKSVTYEDFVNYKKISMFVGFSRCSFKCDKECGENVCQNSVLAFSPDISIKTSDLIEKYKESTLSEALVCGGLEPFENFIELTDLVGAFRQATDDDIVIYTGYTEEEIATEIELLSYVENVIVKFGRYIPHRPRRFDELLGVYLASDNQYAKRIS